MTTLHVALADGFADDAVTVRINGHTVYRKEGLRTDLRISRAGAVDLPLENGGTTRLSVEARGFSTDLDVDAAQTPHVTVDLTPEGRPVLKPSADPAPML